ncbi:MAG: hypothetical protein VX278_12715, partial [Myxococcota bacterium]|nr:hypothetical protein [Myxococcota bacterium]
MLIYLFCALGWASPVEPLSIVEEEAKSLAVIEQNLLSKGFRLTEAKTNVPGVFARTIMDTPSFLAMLNRQGIEHNLVEELVAGEISLHSAERNGTKIISIFREESLDTMMIAFPKKVIYPVLDPFSAKRNDRLNEVIRYLSRGCRNFDVHLQNGSRQWKGEKCAAGT